MISIKCHVKITFSYGFICQSRLAGYMVFSTGLLIHHQSCEHGILKVDKLILMPIGTSGLWSKNMKRLTLDDTQS